MQVKVSRLHKLVHEVNRLWLLKTVLFRSADKHVVCLLTTVLLVVVVQSPSDHATSFLLNDDKESKYFDGPAGAEPQRAINPAVLVKSLHFKPFK